MTALQESVFEILTRVVIRYTDQLDNPQDIHYREQDALRRSRSLIVAYIFTEEGKYIGAFTDPSMPEELPGHFLAGDYIDFDNRRRQVWILESEKDTTRVIIPPGIQN